MSINRNDPPGESASLATQELLRLTESNPQGLPILDPVNDIGINNIDTVEQFFSLNSRKVSLRSSRCLLCPQFKDHVRYWYTL